MALQVRRPLEYGLISLFDDSVRDDLPDHDPNVQTVLCHGSTLTVAAQSYVDGDVLITICVDEPCDLDTAPERLGPGLLEVPGGRLRMTTAGWLDDDVLDRYPGRYDVVVHADDVEDPAAVAVLLARLPDW